MVIYPLLLMMKVDITSTLIDINGNVEISGTAVTTGVHTFTAVPVFPNNTIETADIQADAVTNAKIADDQIDSEHYVDGSIDTAHIGADQITNAKIADDQIDSEHYVDGSIDTAHIADGQVTVAKLATAVFTGATDIGAAIVDADLFLMDDGAGGTIRKTTASRLKTYAGVTGKTIRAVSVVQDNTNYNHTNSGFTNFGNGLSYTPATTSSQVMAFIDVVVSAYSDNSDNDARTPIKFGTNNAAGNTIYESTNAGNNIGYTNISDPTIYGGLSATIGTCQRDGSNNVVVKIGSVSNQDGGTIINLFHQKATFVEIE